MRSELDGSLGVIQVSTSSRVQTGVCDRSELETRLLAQYLPQRARNEEEEGLKGEYKWHPLVVADVRLVPMEVILAHWHEKCILCPTCLWCNGSGLIIGVVSYNQFKNKSCI